MKYFREEMGRFRGAFYKDHTDYKRTEQEAGIPLRQLPQEFKQNFTDN